MKGVDVAVGAAPKVNASGLAGAAAVGLGLDCSGVGSVTDLVAAANLKPDKEDGAPKPSGFGTALD